MAYAQLLSTTNSQFPSASTTHNVAMPATVAAGDLLMVIFSTITSKAISPPAGWTELAEWSEPNANQSISIKVADGTEGGTSPTWTMSPGEKATAQCLRWQAGTWGSIHVSTGQTYTSASSFDQVGLTDVPWGAKDTVYVVTAGGLSTSSATGIQLYPSGYSNGNVAIQNTTSFYGFTATATKQSTAASENPGAWSFNGGATNYGVGFVIAISPANVWAAYVQTGADDGYSTGSGSLDTTGTQVFRGNWGGTLYTTGYFRFLNVQVEPGVTVTSAVLRWTTLNAGSNPNQMTQDLYMNDADDAAQPTSGADLAGKARTTAFTVFDDWSAYNVGGVRYTSPDFAAAVQEVLDRAGWAAGNDMMLLWDDGGTGVNTLFYIASFNNGSGYPAPALVIEYEVAAGGFTGWGSIPI